MKIAISAKGSDLSSAIDPRFGRAQYFIIFDTDNDDFEVVPNKNNAEAAQGAGIQAAETVIRKKVDMVVSGNLGPKAFDVLSEAGIKAALWSDGTVSQAIGQIKKGQLQPIDKPNVGEHWS
jgi:predicted Fe-Mo cluster-binding NifX family protein